MIRRYLRRLVVDDEELEGSLVLIPSKEGHDVYVKGRIKILHAQESVLAIDHYADLRVGLVVSEPDFSELASLHDPGFRREVQRDDDRGRDRIIRILEESFDRVQFRGVERAWAPPGPVSNRKTSAQLSISPTGAWNRQNSGTACASGRCLYTRQSYS